MSDLPQPIVAIPLKRLALCLSCECGFYLNGWSSCPNCGDEHFAMVENFIGSIKNETAGSESPEPAT